MVTLEERRVIISAEHVEELKGLLERHEQDSDCQREGNCCVDLLVEFLDELLADE